MKKNYLLLMLFVSSFIIAQKRELGGTPVQGIIPIKRAEIVEQSAKQNDAQQQSQVLSSGTPTGNSTEVGVTEGQLSVSLTGGANYTIPIAVPPGINGTAPQISLAYSSQGGNGLAGYGWNISGASTITRIPATKFHDGTIDAVDFDNLDRFALDGQRMMLKNGTAGTYGANGTIYETENFSNVKITSFGVSPYGANYGPQYFLVEYPDGSKAYYGNSADSRSQTDWAITYWENPQGVRINYLYTNSNNSLSVNEISYGSLGTTLPINKIQFIYQPRLRSEQAYVGGLSFSRTTILKEIRVIGNGTGFRNYILTHSSTSLGYEKLISVTEKSGDNTKSYNPTVFSYENFDDNSTFFNLESAASGFANVRNTNTASINGDFDGDGKIDIIYYPISSPQIGYTNPDEKKKYWLSTNLQGTGVNNIYEHNVGSFEEIFPVTWLGGDANYGYKLSHTQGWNIVKHNQSTNITSFSTYSKGTVSPVYFQYEKTYQFPKFTYGYWREPCVNKSSESNKLPDPIDPNDPVWVEIVKDIPKLYLNGDFNGDALSDIIVIERPVSYQVTLSCSTYTVTHNSGLAYFVDLDKRVENNYVNNASGVSSTQNSRFFVSDFNGDGKSDIIVIDEGVVKVYTLNDAKQLVLLFSQNNAAIKSDMQVLIGDYNGDGKSDFVIPQQLDEDSWSFFFSNGVNLYDVATSSIGFKYFSWKCNYTVKNSEVYHMSNDFNGDGKTDILQFVNSVEPNSQCNFTHDGEPYTSVFRMAENKISGVNQIVFNVRVEGGIENLYSGIINNYGIRRFPLLTLLDYKNQNNNLEFSLVIVDKIHTFTYKKDNKKDTSLKEITLGNGVKEAITYKPLKYEEANYYTTIYEDNRYVENYPNFDIVVAPTLQVVSKLEKSSLSTYKSQEYKYFGATSNVEGLGFLGFRSIAKTNWFNDDFAVISNISKFDMGKRGALSESYMLLGNYLPSSSLNPSTFINKSVLTYQDELLPNKVFKITNTSSVAYSGIDGTSKEVLTSYDEYNNPFSSKTYTRQGANVVKSDETIIEYDNLPLGTPYIIGRPKKKNTSSVGTNPLDNIDSEEIYTYSNGLLSKIQKRGFNTNYITEENEYDNFGNITLKTISAFDIEPRITKYEYDSSGRFLEKSHDIEGLITQFTYNISNGLILTETSPYGLSTTYVYDVWGKKIKITDYLGKNKNIVYSNSLNPQLVDVTITADDGSASFKWLDDLGREIITGEKKIDDVWSYVSTQYDIYDRKTKVSEPYIGLATTPTQFTTTTYDEYGRLTQTVEHTGKTTNISYSGLTTTVVDDIKTEVITKNAIGNIISKTDNGGTINYQYYIDGNLKQSDYNGTVIEIEQDGWGRKTKLIDPSAGEYTYTYNTLGETLSETTPNGVTTYLLNEFGKVIEKTIVGTNTNSKTTYTYDASSKLLIQSRFDDYTTGSAINYGYGYDSYKRLNFKDESGALAYYQQATQYDTFGRPEKELYTAILTANNKRSDKWVKNTYKNGYHWQILDDATSQVLWQTNTVNERGQLTGAAFGNGITIANSYDQYGFPTQFKHDKTGTPTVNIMTLNTVFEPQRGNLTSRFGNLFNLTETFEYDNLERLVKWSTPPVVIHHNTFTSGVEGFVAINPSTVSIFSGQLKVAATGNAGAKKTLVAQALAGEKLSISLYVGIGNTPNIRVYIIETNNITGEIQVFNKLTITRNGTRTFDHTASQNSSIEIQIIESLVGLEEEDTTSSYFYLDNFVVTKYPLEVQDYDDRGRITQNSLGVYNYSNSSKVYRNTSLDPSPETLAYYTAKPLQTVTYNVFKGPVKIEEPGIDIINFTYNAVNGRSSMFYGGLQSDMYARPLRKHYSADGTMEIKHNIQTDQVEFVTYIGGDGYSAPVVLKGNGTTQEYLYLHRDYQGTIVAITNQSGNVVEKRHFDVWGAIVKVQDGSGNVLNALTVLDRGYTGHEHLQSVGLIHMNGRLYDPKLHRFLQPDNYVQDPYNTQNFNRYGYVMNNPTKFTDPSGEFWHIVIGAAIGGVINWGIHGFRFDMQGLKAFGIGAVAGGLGAATGGAAFGLAGGGAAAGSGGFLAGAFGGMVGSAYSTMVLSMGNNMAFGDPLMTGRQFLTNVAFGGVLGGTFNGITALFNGRTFWMGTAPRVAVQPITIQTAGIVKGEPLQPTTSDIAIPRVATPQEIEAAAKPQVFEKIVSTDGKTAWKANGLLDRQSDLAAKTSTKMINQFSSSTIDDSVALTMKQKGTHIFANKLHPKPYLNQLSEQMGGQENVIRAALQDANGRFPISGVINDLPVNVGGMQLYIKGYINNGKPIINSLHNGSLL